MHAALAEPPRSVCLLRLSAIGDTCHVVPVVRTLQQAWPDTQLTWIIGKAEARLMSLDRRRGVYHRRQARRPPRASRICASSCAAAQFDVLLHMQLAFRASLIARAVPRRRSKLGFDRARARELQWLFTNARIAARSREHVLDSFFGFLDSARHQGARAAAGTSRCRRGAREYAQNAHSRRATDAGHQPLLQSLAAQLAGRTLRCSGRLRGAPARHARHPVRRPDARWSARRRGYRSGRCKTPAHQPDRQGHAAADAGAAEPRDGAAVAPDSGPAHMATMVGTPVIGLYAATNPARSGPYLSRLWCVNAYPEAARRFRGTRAGGAALDRKDRGARRDGPHHASRRSPPSSTSCYDSGRERRRPMKDILVPISPGELLDKITILRIKAARIDRCREARERAAGARGCWRRPGATAAAPRRDVAATSARCRP